MYSLLNKIFEDKHGDFEFTCFSPWHFFYIFLVIGLVAAIILIFRKKDQAVKERVLKWLIAVPFALYMSDFFLMPFAYGEIYVDKLPFHACTLLSILSFASNNSKFLKRFRVHFAVFALISNLIYVVYPSGVAGTISPICYRVIQTMLFHSLMVVYSIVTLLFDKDGLRIKRCYIDVIILSMMSSWALIGNTFYSGTTGNYSGDFNWFFVKADPLGIFPTDISPYIMPWLNVIVFFILELVVYILFTGIRHAREGKNK